MALAGMTLKELEYEGTPSEDKEKQLSSLLYE